MRGWILAMSIWAFFASARNNKHLGFFKKNVRYETFF